MLRGHPIRVAVRLEVPLALALLASLVAPTGARAGGQGSSIPPFSLPVRQTELRVALQSPMVCVANPQIRCDAPFLDADSGSTNSDGGTFRSTSCPGGSPPGACRPAYVPGAELTGELVVDWPITRTPPDPDPGIDPGLNCGAPPFYKICYEGHIELNISAPGVSVANPIAVIDEPGECDCFDNPADELSFGGILVDDYWVPRTTGATCDIALEYATLMPRAAIRAIGQQAFPTLLCNPQGGSPCTLQPEPVFIEPDGSLTKGCGSGGTFTIRFTLPNEPLPFVKQALPVQPLALADVNGDGDLDLVTKDAESVWQNNGSNLFSAVATGLPAIDFTSAAVGDWNHNGAVDLVADPLGAGGVRVYTGDGSGGFSSAASFQVDASDSTGLTLRHMNADARLDAVSDRGATAAVILNQTGGAVSPAVQSIASELHDVNDLDADSARDLICEGSAGAVRWAANSGPGTFPLQTLVTVPDGLDALNGDPIAGDELVPLLGQEIVDVLRCDETGSDCCTAHFSGGCDDAACEALVCAEDDFCCDEDFGEWGDNCEALADSLCSACIDPEEPDCCQQHGGAGCEDPTCEEIVCVYQPQCCSSPWDATCVAAAVESCNGCMNYDVRCQASVDDVAGADVEGDGDQDLIVSLTVEQELTHPQQDRDTESGYWVWLPNRQVDDPPASSGNPLFQPGVAPWRLLGPAPAKGGTGGSRIEMVDLDGDGDPDALGTFFWYRNDAGAFSGPYALDGYRDVGALPDASLQVLFSGDADEDGDVDVVSFDTLYVPEPGGLAMLCAGVGALVLLARRRARR
jgi:hypothetical protein